MIRALVPILVVAIAVWCGIGAVTVAAIGPDPAVAQLPFSTFIPPQP